MFQVLALVRWRASSGMPAGLQGEILWLFNVLNHFMIFISPFGHIMGILGRHPTIIERLASYEVGRPPLCERST